MYEDEDYLNLSELERKTVREHWRKTFRECRIAAMKARENIDNNVSEDAWQFFMNAHLFHRYHEGWSSLLDGHYTDKTFDKYAMRTNVLWSEAGSRRELFDSKHAMSDPKPDIFFGFPIERPGQQAARGFERSASVYNFSLQRLYALTRKGLYSSPTRGLANYGPDRPFTRTASLSMSDNDLVCFPFAVVELKHSYGTASRESFCFCQAANAASAALSMLEKLYGLADKGSTNAHVPPVVAFTCIGPQVRVWIAYSVCAPGGRARHFMIPIWQLPMISVWAILEMQSILRNLMRWTTRVLRPNISSQLSRWRWRKSDASDPDIMFEEATVVAQDRKPLSQVVDERAYWNGKLYGAKRPPEEQPEESNKRVASGKCSIEGESPAELECASQ